MLFTLVADLADCMDQDQVIPLMQLIPVLDEIQYVEHSIFSTVSKDRRRILKLTLYENHL